MMNTPSLVFLDEAGVHTALANNYGWAAAGETPVIERPARGKNITLIGAIALNGPRALEPIDGYLNGEKFIEFIRQTLGPALNEGDVVVMDGPRVHRVAGVAEALAEFGATAVYLPAYSPELNPIEMAWAWLKRLLRKWAPRKPARVRQLVNQVWNGLTADLCAGWIKHSGYAVVST